MHVVHLGKYYPPYRGGIETVVEQLCRGLAGRGHEVTALVSNDGPATVREWIDGVRVIRVGRQMVLQSQPLNWGLTGILRGLDFDVLHFHAPNPIGAAVCLLGRRGRPVVATHHSDIVRQRLLGYPASLLHAALYRKATAILAGTPRNIEYSQFLSPFRDRCRVVHFPIDPAPFMNAPSTWDPALPVDWQLRPLALFVGRLVYYKGLDVLLRALAEVPDLGLAVVGSGPLRDKLEVLAKQMRVEGRVRFVADVDAARLASLYRRASFLVLPSTAPSEAFGMVQLEAMAAGTAVISTDLKSGVPYVNQHGVTGLIVPPGDVVALAQAMRTLGAQPELRTQLGQAAKLRVLQEFQTDRVLDALLAIYEEALKSVS